MKGDFNLKILTVFTGGTIGSSITDGIADVDGGTAGILLDLYKDRTDVEFECISPFNILSENLDCDTLSRLCSFMLSIDFEKYDGVIVTHGSDTLSFTSAMLGLALSWVRIPIVITAADCVLTMPESNGMDNFNASVDFIRDFYDGEHSNTGVFTIWKNHGENVRVYISTRLNEADGYLDSFSGWGGIAFGTIENGSFKRYDSKINPQSTKPCEKTAYLKGKEIRLKSDVMLLQSYVGLDFNSVDINGKSAVLLKLYHSATACTQGENTSFSIFADRCAKNGTDVYIFPAKKSEYIYKSAEGLNSGTVVPMYNINTASAYSKLLLAYAVGDMDIIGSNLFYESPE